MVNLHPNPGFRANAACVLGSTGSVGTQTLDVLREMNVPVVMMTAGENTALFAEQIIYIQKIVHGFYSNNQK